MRTALEPLGVQDLELDCTSRSASFKAPADMDLDAVLAKAAEAEEHLQGWKRK